ncbi:hypothetical protein [Streptomyces sp. NPDC048650]|uniref:hypothetical protein n=1 Tax=Streptomyces sp. NPDC048650 TaxID=3365583 RepID=UPI00371EBF0D
MRALHAAVGVVAVAALLTGCSGGSDGPADKKSGSSRSADGTAGSGNGSGSGGGGGGGGKVSVHFTVTSNLPLNISLSGATGASGHTEEFKNVKAPWSKTVEVEKGRYPAIAVAPVDAAQKGKVACEMLVGAKRAAHDSGKGTGSSLVVDCSSAT